MGLRRQTLLGGVIVLQWIIIGLLLTVSFAGATPLAQDSTGAVLAAAQQAQSAASLATILSIIALVISLAALLSLAAMSFNPRKES